jgi:hypothetical protein
VLHKSAFDALGAAPGDYYPEPLRAEIARLVEWINGDRDALAALRQVRCRPAAVAAMAAISRSARLPLLRPAGRRGEGLAIPEGVAHHQVVGRLRDLDSVIFVKAERPGSNASCGFGPC